MPKSSKSKKAAPKTVRTAAKAKFSSITDLISQSWSQLTVHFGTYAILFFIQIFVFMLLFGITAVVMVGTGLGVGLSGMSPETLFQDGNFWLFLSRMGSVFIVLGSLAFILFMAIGVFFQGAMIAVAAGGDKKVGIGEAMHVARMHWMQLLIAGVVGGLIVLGGFFFFLIPGIIFSIFFTLAAYAIVIDNYKAIEALKYTAGLVKQNFWEVVGRLLILIAINFAITFLVSFILEMFRGSLGDSAVSLIGSIVNIVVNIGIMGFTVIYATLLYRQLRTATGVTPMSLTWVVVIAVLGLVMFALLIGSVISAARYALDNIPRGLENEVMNLESDFESDRQNMQLDYENMTEDDWEQLMMQALEEATASGNSNGSNSSTNQMMQY